MLAAERDDSELVCDSLRYVEAVQLGVQQPRQAQVELVGTGKDTSSSVEHSLKFVETTACQIWREFLKHRVEQLNMVKHLR